MKLTNLFRKSDEDAAKYVLYFQDSSSKRLNRIKSIEKLIKNKK